MYKFNWNSMLGTKVINYLKLCAILNLLYMFKNIFKSNKCVCK